MVTMTEELKHAEVWVRAVLNDPVPDDDGDVEVVLHSSTLATSSLVLATDIRKSLPEITEAKERVVEAAKAWRHTKPGTEDDEEAISVLSQAVNALEAAEKPSLEEEIEEAVRDAMVPSAGPLSFHAARLKSLILAIVEKHKGESS